MIAPNFEERSTGVVNYINNHIAIDSSNSIVHITTLQAQKPKEILDEIKDANAQYAVRELTEKGIILERELITYPTNDPTQYFTKIIDFIGRHTNRANIFLDISSVPRGLIFKLFDFLFGRVQGSEILLDNLTISNLFLIYSQAYSYPRTVDADLLGIVKGTYNPNSISTLLNDKDVVDIVIFLNGNGHDAAQTFDEVSEANTNVQKHIFIYLNKANFLHSYRKMNNSLNVINRARIQSGKIQYVFSMEDISHSLKSIVDETVHSHSLASSSAFYIGAYGPKPIGMCGYIAIRYYEKMLNEKIKGLQNQNRPHNKSFRTDILGLAGAQYTSIYSFGYRQTNIYKVDLSIYGIGKHLCKKVDE